jgi:hypothetical protein
VEVTMLTLEEFKQLDALTVQSGASDELLEKVLPFYNAMREASEVLAPLDLAETPIALVYRAGSVR